VRWIAIEKVEPAKYGSLTKKSIRASHCEQAGSASSQNSSVAMPV